MRPYFFLICLLSATTPLLAQPQITFDAVGRLSMDTYPTLLHGHILLADKDRVAKPNSFFSDSILAYKNQLDACPTAANVPGSILAAAKAAVNANVQRMYADITARQGRKDWVGFEYDDASTLFPLKFATPTPTYPTRLVATPGTTLDQTASPATLTFNKKADSARFSLVRANTDNPILAKHLEKTIGSYRGMATYLPLLRNVNALLRQHLPAIDSVLVLRQLTNRGNAVDMILLEKLKAVNEAYDLSDKIYEKVLTNNAEWIKAWLWYTGGAVRLNPFVVFDPAPVLERVEADLRILTERLTGIQNQYTPPNVPELTLLVNEIKALEKQKAQLTALLPGYKSWLAARSISEKTLYSSIWYVSDANQLNWMHHVEAKDTFAALHEPGQLPNMVALGDQVYVCTHNVKTTDQVTLTASQVAFTPTTGLEDELTSITNAFGSVKGSLATGLVGLVGTLIGQSRGGGSSTILSFRSNIPFPLDDITSIFYNLQLNQFEVRRSQSQPRFDWLLAQTEPIRSLKPEPDNTPVWRTVSQRGSQQLTVDKSMTISYKGFLNGAKEPIFEGSYNTYKQARLLPIVGVGYVFSDRAGSVFQEGKWVSESFSNIEALLGVKWYVPLRKNPKANPTRHAPTTRLIGNNVPGANLRRGNAFQNRLFLAAGFGLSNKILRNYFVGAGFDLVPGISLHGGANILFKRYYQFENGQQTGEQERPNVYGYVSLSFDPGIVTQFVKLLTRP